MCRHFWWNRRSASSSRWQRKREKGVPYKVSSSRQWVWNFACTWWTRWVTNQQITSHEGNHSRTNSFKMSYCSNRTAGGWQKSAGLLLHLLRDRRVYRRRHPKVRSQVLLRKHGGKGPNAFGDTATWERAKTPSWESFKHSTLLSSFRGHPGYFPRK